MLITTTKKKNPNGDGYLYYVNMTDGIYGASFVSDGSNKITSENPVSVIDRYLTQWDKAKGGELVYHPGCECVRENDAQFQAAKDFLQACYTDDVRFAEYGELTYLIGE